MTLGRAGNKTRRVKVHDDPGTQLSACPRPIRQLAVTGLGHDQPTLLITNQAQLPARQVIQSYARRMNIEQRLAEAIQSFSLDALAGAVPLDIDLMAAPIRMSGVLEPFIGQAVLVEKRVRSDGARSNAASATFGELASRRQSETDGIGDAAA